MFVHGRSAQSFVGATTLAILLRRSNVSAAFKADSSAAEDHAADEALGIYPRGAWARKGLGASPVTSRAGTC